MANWYETMTLVKSQFPESIVEEYFPKSWMPKGQLKAIILGADPSNDKGDRFDHPFGLYDPAKGEKNKMAAIQHG